MTFSAEVELVPAVETHETLHPWPAPRHGRQVASRPRVKAATAVASIAPACALRPQCHRAVVQGQVAVRGSGATETTLRTQQNVTEGSGRSLGGVLCKTIPPLFLSIGYVSYDPGWSFHSFSTNIVFIGYVPILL